MEIVKYNVGDVLKLKKKHPCGSDEWVVTRIGADFKIKCMGCDHVIMIPRHELQKDVKKIIKKAEEDI